jgi:hypothetical protein
LVTFSIPVVAAAQQPSADSLLRRIDLLERRSADLEQRVRALEAGMKGEPSRDLSVPTSAKSQDLQNWRRLRIGMKMDEVRVLLGEPDRVVVIGATHWYYPGGDVSFDSRGKLEGWFEPSR